MILILTFATFATVFVEKPGLSRSNETQIALFDSPKQSLDASSSAHRDLETPHVDDP
jgi:hypothetical protein